MKKILLIAIVLAGLGFRLGGIAYGLRHAEIYHPDTPKQVHAVGHFFRGEMYRHVGIRDYDGYPLFVSYLTSLLVRAGDAVVSPLLALAGQPSGGDVPPILTLYFIMRMVNVALATLAIIVAWKIGKESFGEGAGLLAAMFLAISPADIASCHYESGDTGAAVFGLISVLFSMRVFRNGRLSDYVWSGFFASLAFASKYHAIVVFATAGLAHILRRENFGRWHKPESLLRLAVLGIAAFVGLVFAIPGLRVQPVAMIRDILVFMDYAANFGLTPELKTAGFTGKLAFSLQRNLPILLGLMSAGVVIAAFSSLARVRRDPRVLLLLAAPLFYFFAGVSMRPYAHPVYHTIMTAPVFLLAAAAIARPFAHGSESPTWTRYAAMALVAGALIQLGHAACREVFFFRRDTTNRLTKLWVEENLPASYQYIHGRHTFRSAHFTGNFEGASGIFFVSPSICPAKHPLYCERWFTIGAEDESLPYFRNPTMDIWLDKRSSFPLDGRMPVFQRIASEIDASSLQTGIPEFFRSTRIFAVRAGQKIERTIVSREKLADVLVTVSSDENLARARVEVGGHARTLRVEAGSTQTFVVENPRRRMVFGTGWYFYDFAIEARLGAARVSVAFTPSEKGVDLFQQGSVREAAPWLRTAATAEKNPTLAAMALIASGNDCPLQERADLLGLAGIGRSFAGYEPLYDGWKVQERFLAGIPYLKWNGADFDRPHTSTVANSPGEDDFNPDVLISGAGSDSFIGVRDIWLEPGAYTVRLRARSATTNALASEVRFVFNQGNAPVTNLAARAQLPADGSYAEFTNAFQITRMFRGGSLRIELPEGTPVGLDELEIRPDHRATLTALWARLASPSK